MRTKPEESILRVGGGRGFVVHDGESGDPIIVTAAHCLPTIELENGRHVLTIPPHRASYAHERAFPLVGPLGGEPSYWVECLFAAPIADVALLGEPDHQHVYRRSGSASSSGSGGYRPFGSARRTPRRSGFSGSMESGTRRQASISCLTRSSPPATRSTSREGCRAHRYSTRRAPSSRLYRRMGAAPGSRTRCRAGSPYRGLAALDARTPRALAGPGAFLSFSCPLAPSRSLSFDNTSAFADPRPSGARLLPGLTEHSMQYRVIEKKASSFLKGRMTAAQFEELINTHAGEGWELDRIVAGETARFMGMGGKDVFLLIFKKAN